MKIRLLLYVFISFGCLNVFAQQELIIKADKAFYCSGEKIGIVVSNTSETEPEIIYLEILDKNSRVLSHLSTKSDGRIATAILDLPLDWKSEWYFIRAYSIWVPSIEIKDIGYKALAVYNEFDHSAAEETKSIVQEELESMPFQIQTNRKNYQKGDELEVRLKTFSPEKPSSWVISILDKAAYNQLSTFPGLKNHLSVSIPKRIAEVGEAQHKLLYLGKLQSFGNNGLAAIYIAEEKGFNWLSLNEEQTFGIELEAFPGVKHAEIFSMQAIGGIIYLEPQMYYPSSTLPQKQYQLGELPYTPEVISYLDAARKRRMIADIYNKIDKEDSVSLKQKISFIKADKSYSPGDFIRFSNTEDFINEVATFIKLRKTEKNTYTIRVMMERNVLAEYEPAMFLNGYLLTDPKEILELDLDQIERIDVYRKERTILKQFKTLGRNGVVAIYTKNPNIQPKSSKKIQLVGFQKNHTEIKLDLSPNMPNFSPRLYWNTSIKPNEQGEATFSLNLGDDMGEYVILVESYTEKGVGRAAKSFFVTGKPE